MRRTFNALFVAAASLYIIAGGCSSNRTYVLQDPPPGSVLTGVALRGMDSSIKIDPAQRTEFEKILAEKITEIYGSQPQADGDLIIQYRFVLFDQGNTAFRVGSNVANLAGSPFYGLGDGAVGIEVIYLRKDGTRLGHVVTDGSISGAFGNTSSGLDQAASSIAKYTKSSFSCPTCGQTGVSSQPSKVPGLRTLKDPA